MHRVTNRCAGVGVMWVTAQCRTTTDRGTWYKPPATRKIISRLKGLHVTTHFRSLRRMMQAFKAAEAVLAYHRLALRLAWFGPLLLLPPRRRRRHRHRPCCCRRRRRLCIPLNYSKEKYLTHSRRAADQSKQPPPHPLVRAHIRTGPNVSVARHFDFTEVVQCTCMMVH